MKPIVILAFVCITGVSHGQFPVNVGNAFSYASGGSSSSSSAVVFNDATRFVAPLAPGAPVTPFFWPNRNSDGFVFEDNPNTNENVANLYKGQGPGPGKPKKNGNGGGNRAANGPNANKGGNGNKNKGGNGNGNRGGMGNGNRGQGNGNKGPGGNKGGPGNGNKPPKPAAAKRPMPAAQANKPKKPAPAAGPKAPNANKNKPGVTKKPNMKRVSQIKYEQYLASIFPDAGVMEEVTDFSGRELARPGQFPHMGAIGFRNTVLNRTEYKCGASLISDSYALTSAHCTEFNGLPPNYVRFGDLNLRAAEEDIDPQTRQIARVINHPQYTEEALYHDIALLQLARPVIFTEFVRPIRLWHRDRLPFTNAFAMGFGAVQFAGAATNRLTEFNLTIIPNDICEGLMPKQPNAKFGIIESQICAVDYKKSGSDTFQGDSGGPLQVSFIGRRRGRLHEYLIGITSFGVLGATRLPGVYTRVSSYVDWIEEIVWCDYCDL